MRKSKKTETALLKMHRKLSEHFGPLNWWPGETPFEIAVGAILTQNTNWSNVEKAITNLKSQGALAPKALYALPEQELARLIRPSGYYNMKAGRLRSFLRFLFERYGGSLRKMFLAPTDDLRVELLAINGIGPETADSILLYAGGKQTFVIDAYTRRALSRHGLIDGNEDYEDIRRLMEANLPRDVALYNEFHAQFVNLGKHYCRPQPQCEGCPLAAMKRRNGTGTGAII